MAAAAAIGTMLVGAFSAAEAHKQQKKQDKALDKADAERDEQNTKISEQEALVNKEQVAEDVDREERLSRMGSNNLLGSPFSIGG